ncbi:homeobox protein Nkx-2.3-like isoform X2 [Mustela nigripes]|uniref:homeobox protein Nkx-2.3-like isoform X2 n=1 Tax=Mustela nigripes TaxID=77151 RepID=UPI002816424F|nr:homeobox protein Nkx-2.3-like isoform X2 [Mustela nigripes]
MKSCSIRGCGAKRGLLPRASASRAAGQAAAAAAAAEVVTGTGRGRCAGGGGGGGGKSGMTMSTRLPQSAAGGARWRKNLGNWADARAPGALCSHPVEGSPYQEVFLGLILFSRG